MADPMCFLIKAGLARPGLCEAGTALMALQKDKVELRSRARTKVSPLSIHALQKQRKAMEANRSANLRLSRNLHRTQQPQEGEAPNSRPTTSELQLIKSIQPNSETGIKKLKQTTSRGRMPAAAIHGFRYHSNGEERRMTHSNKQQTTPDSGTESVHQVNVTDKLREAKTHCLVSAMLHSRDQMGSYYCNPFLADLFWRDPLEPRFHDDAEFGEFLTQIGPQPSRHKVKTDPRVRAKLERTRRRMYSVDRKFLVRENRQFIKDTMKNVSHIEKAMASSEKLSRTISGNNPPPYVPVVMPGRPLGRATSQPGRRDRLPTSSSTSRRHFSEPLLFANKAGTPKERRFLSGVSSPVLRHRKLLLDRYKQEETQQMSVTRSKVDNYVSDIQLEVQRCRKLRRGVSADDHDVSAPESEADEVKE